MERRIPPSRHPGLTESQRSSGGEAVGHIHDPEPMQVGRARLSREEKERRRSQGLCMYCGAAGHFASHLPGKRASPTVGMRLLSGEILRRKDLIYIDSPPGKDYDGLLTSTTVKHWWTREQKVTSWTTHWHSSTDSTPTTHPQD